MNKEIIIEINRIRELCGLSLILESIFPWSIFDEITTWVGKTADEDLFTFISNPNANVRATQLLDELEKVSTKLGLKNTEELVGKLEKKTLSDLEADELGSALLRAGNKELQDVVYKAYLKTSQGAQIMNNTLNMTKTQDIINSGNQEAIEELRKVLKGPIEQSTELGDEVRRFYYDLIDEKLGKIKKIEPSTDLIKNVKKRLASNFVSFKDNFKTLYRTILETRGKNWKEVLTQPQVDENLKFLNFLKVNFPEKKWKFLHKVTSTQPKEGSIDELLGIIENYKLFGNVSDEYNLFNFFDTNTNQNTTFFLRVAEEFLSQDEYKKMIDLINDAPPNTSPSQELKDLTKKVFDYLYSEDANKIWDDVLTNSNSKYILKTESLSSGTQAEQLFKDWIGRLSKSGQNFELVWAATNGSPIDRILGVDAIIKIDGITYSVQIKKFSGTISTKKGKSSLGEYYTIFSATRKEFNENVDYGCAVDGNGRIIMMGKQAKVSKEGGELVVDKTNLTIRLLYKTVFIDDPKQGMKTYVNFDAINLQDLEN